ncbi:unnamed protein product [Symbiodinium natans]|uniref:Uncharacterized protein n=1 Tax=Symbiodinium natans TaxID=878477 RepID=A0A812J5X9_9DINO|nr:unnamed protein product [Symbiodinium natans]
MEIFTMPKFQPLVASEEECSPCVVATKLVANIPLAILYTVGMLCGVAAGLTVGLAVGLFEAFKLLRWSVVSLIRLWLGASAILLASLLTMCLQATWSRQ